MEKIQVVWMDAGPSLGRVDTVARRYVLEDGPLVDGHEVHVQMSKKRGSKARIWNAKVVMLIDNDWAREPVKKRRKRDITPAHIRRCEEKQAEDQFEFTTGPPPDSMDKEEQLYDEKLRKRREEDEEWERKMEMRKKEKEDAEQRHRRRLAELQELEKREENALENGLKLGEKNLRKKKPEEMKWRTKERLMLSNELVLQTTHLCNTKQHHWLTEKF